jgi:hypothetical protein
VYGMMDLELTRERRRELLREAKGRRVAREAARPAAGNPDEGGISVRWGLAEDEAAVADLLQLNGMPRWVAFEERFVVAEKDGGLIGALRYATESKRLSLGLLVVDPWAGERRTARALYFGAAGLARELGATEVLANAAWGSGYLGEAGYRRAGRGWRLEVSARTGRVSSGGWRAALGHWTARVLPFGRALR